MRKYMIRFLTKDTFMSNFFYLKNTNKAIIFALFLLYLF
ncbi:hypothetical protein NT01EI_2976 [Edwardsiella ictaluri 93-146]|uniref:Uncharacterized protein n=1 Tax=Edwardsiella ictaluri (strain 93-146) TaxID=634503 RepID=C5B8S7_EDWI9|nr:hypothetical protein NT01EI_2976 [Edwardsiella ictaluri 93-146]